MKKVKDMNHMHTVTETPRASVIPTLPAAIKASERETTPAKSGLTRAELREIVMDVLG
ncbi:hypothetical protein OCH7691_00040 [Oceanibacterium hippocampi]|uniref:Uncharacterized protein n=2 Tax=Oceanibacterium hippocampi TaxID=745714 RepID=A0A1Y5R785_9PROT|nr:hypothetical protein OCH7691_00040 [Oceanibacterium hippocampi]